MGIVGTDRFRKYVIGILGLTGFFLLGLAGTAVANDSSGNRYLQMSLQQLMQVKITSVSKKEESLSDAAAAVFVITGEDIRRSGVTSVPEALRMAPGVEVARIDANKWAISIRGFNGRFANKLLVLIDGRSVYSPISSGVFWDEQDTLLEDIDRIEVIRGPGATLWGVNAVNGVINIITKHAKDTQGVLLTAGSGTEEKAFGGFRLGGHIGESTFYRVYAKAFKRDNFKEPSGRDGNDEWDYLRSGFRIDSGPSLENSFTLQGEIYDGTSNTRAVTPSLLPPYSKIQDTKDSPTGGDILGRWKHTFSDSSQMVFQTYYDNLKAGDQTLHYTTDKVDFDLQYRFMPGKRQELTAGLEYCFIRTDTDAGLTMGFDPETCNDSLYGGFLQDEITLIPDRLHLTLGSKFGHNDYSGFEIQPSGRILWKIAKGDILWASISRAVRTSLRAEADAHLKASVLPPSGVSPFPTLVVLEANHDFDSEKLLAYELGYRKQFADRFSLDVAAFYNHYSDLRTLEPVSTVQGFSLAPVPHFELHITDKNKMDADTYGLELAVNVRVTDWWRLSPGYSYCKMSLHPEADSLDTTAKSAEGETPKNQFSIRSSMDLPWDLELDGWLRYVDELPAQDMSGYVTMDIRLGWQPFKSLEVSFTGRNLLDNQHPEFLPEIYGMVPTEIERSFYGKLTWHF